MASERFDCRYVAPGLWESDALTMSGEAPLNIAFEAEKCVSAWIEYMLGGVTGRIKILPFDIRRGDRQPQVPDGASYKIVASVGNGGYFKGNVYY